MFRSQKIKLCVLLIPDENQREIINKLGFLKAI